MIELIIKINSLLEIIQIDLRYERTNNNKKDTFTEGSSKFVKCPQCLQNINVKIEHQDEDNELKNSVEIVSKNENLDLSTESYTDSLHESPPKHIDSVRNTSSDDLVCKICNRHFGAKVSLRLHMNTHTDKFRCKVKTCEKGFPNNVRLKNHLIKKHGFAGAKLLSDNISVNDLDDEEDSVWFSQTNLFAVTNILNEPHEKLKKYLCEICGSSYSSNTAYFIHKQNHKDIKFECHLCGKKASRKSIIKKHLLTQHIQQTIPSLKCLICNKNFHTKYSLVAHSRVHQYPRYTCDICDKKFKQSSTLKSHLKIHSGEKSYKCLRCFRSFSTKWTLMEHEKIYADQKSHECKSCSKRFSRKSYLNVHEKIHRK